jgi:protein ImuB
MLLCVNLCDPAAADRALWEELLDALDAVSPLVDDVRPGLAFLEMRGIAGDAATWMERARDVLRPFAIEFRLGLGINKICARAAAHFADGAVCPLGGERTFLAPLTLAVLELEPEILERLRLLGIDRLGDLARLPHGPFVRRFGPPASAWHAWARGDDPTPFVPRGHAVAIEASVFGEGRVDEEAQVVFALRLLLARIVSDLERCGKRAGSLRLDLELEDAQTYNFDVSLASPTANERGMLDVVRAKLENVTFPAPIVGLRLRAGQLEEGGEAVALFADGDFDTQAISVALSRLEAVVGEPVRQARTRNAHALEERFAYERFQLPKREPCASALTLPATDVLAPQLRLLAVTEIDVGVRSGEPAALSFSKNAGSRHAVVRAAGPWRIDIGWFSDAPVARDEYDVLLDDGEVYRIYRQGSHWYLRGFYD